ncbi:MAG: zinc ribbon domain-containing protein [Vicinamibacterales bacterium]
MPLYEYQCDGCGRQFELIRKFSDPPLDACPSCGAAVRKLFSSPAFQFKGSGFYITDYPKKDQPAPGKNDKNDKADKSDKKDGADRTESAKTDGPKSETPKTDTAKSDEKKPSASASPTTTSSAPVKDSKS